MSISERYILIALDFNNNGKQRCKCFGLCFFAILFVDATVGRFPVKVKSRTNDNLIMLLELISFNLMNN